MYEFIRKLFMEKVKNYSKVIIIMIIIVASMVMTVKKKVMKHGSFRTRKAKKINNLREKMVVS